MLDFAEMFNCLELDRLWRESIGFGLQVDVEHHIECVVAEVVSGSHAEKQGVKEGYYIVGVGGKDVRASPYEEVIRLLNLSKEN